MFLKEFRDILAGEMVNIAQTEGGISAFAKGNRVGIGRLEKAEVKLGLIRHLRLVPGRIEDQFYLDRADAGSGADGFLDRAHDLARDRASRCRQRHVDLYVRSFSRDTVNEPEIVNVERNFRIVHGPQGRDHRLRQRMQRFGRRQPFGFGVERRGGPLREELQRFTDRRDERLHLLMRIVKREGGAAGGGDAVALHQRLRAMGSSPHCHARMIKQRRDIMRVGAGDIEGEDRAFVRSAAENLHFVDAVHFLGRMRQQICLMCRDRRAIKPGQPVECDAEPDRLNDRRRTGLEAVRRGRIGHIVSR